MHRDNFKEEEQQQIIQQLVDRYESMLADGDVVFFERHEFIKLLDHYEERLQLYKAFELIEYALSQHPYSATFLVRKAQILSDDNQEPEALALLDTAEMLDASDMDIYLLRADILARYGRYEDAFEVLDNAEIRFSASDRDELYVGYASIYEQQERYDLMYDYLAKALTANPDNEAALERIWLPVEFKQRYAESADLHNKLLDRDAYNHQAWLNLGHAYVGLGRRAEAAEAYEYAFTIQEDFEIAYVHAGETYMDLEDYASALRVYKSALEEFKRHSRFAMQVGNCLRELNELRQARYYYKKSFKYDPNNSQALYLQGETLAQEGRWKEALVVYEKARALSAEPKYLAAVAESHYQLDDNVLANELFKEALLIDLTNDEIWVQYISFLIAVEEYALAHETITLAEQHCEDDLELQCCRVATFYNDKHPKEALQRLQVLLIEDDEAGEVLLDLFPELASVSSIVRLIKDWA